jgi:hypothetical protein
MWRYAVDHPEAFNVWIIPEILILGSGHDGFGLNVEQPMDDNGETGIFGLIGWNDGNHESLSYVESDRHASLGAGSKIPSVYFSKIECGSESR